MLRIFVFSLIVSVLSGCVYNSGTYSNVRDNVTYQVTYIVITDTEIVEPTASLKPKLDLSKCGDPPVSRKDILKMPDIDKAHRYDTEYISNRLLDSLEVILPYAKEITTYIDDCRSKNE